MRSPAEAQQAHAEALVEQVMSRDARDRGFALSVARLLIARLPTADAVAIVKPAKPIDPASMVG